ncbi:MAG: alpha-1,2-fucosyltransferase [Bacteroidota bacterium]
MVIVELSGGLGNQMFEYAAGRSLAVKNNVPLKLFTHKLSRNWHRTYVLKCFNIEEQLISRSETNKLLKQKSCTVYKELPGGFDKKFFEIKGNAFLKGYRQSEKYFKNIDELIKKDFTFKDVPTGKNKDFSEQISNADAVAVHVRRGDFVTINKANARYGGVCDLNYYQKCFHYIKEKISNPVFYIFSDDPKWAEENLKPDAPAVYVSNNSTRKHFKLENNYYFRNSLIIFKNLFPDKSYEDMRLMSSCKHFIIANSSFSWWAAWLGNHKNKIICAPSRWVNAAPDKIETAIKEYNDLIPETWVKF